MKKIYKYILIITIMMLSFIGEVRADDFKTLCTYESTDDGQSLKIGYIKEDELGRYAIYKNDKLERVFNHTFKDEDAKIAEQIKSNVCPQYIHYFHTSYFDTISSYCADNGDNTCANTYSDHTIEWSKKLVTNNMIVANGIAPNVVYNECVDKKECHLLCYYDDKNAGNYDRDYAFIYYFPYEDTFKSSFSWKDNNKVYELKKDSGTAFIGPNELEQLRNAVCPSNIYKDENWYDEDEVCFDSDGEYCITKLSGHFSSKELLEEIEPNTLLTKEQLDKYIPEDNNLYYEEVKEKVESEYNINVYEICAYSESNTKKPNAKQFFIVNTGKSFRFFFGETLKKESGETVKDSEEFYEIKSGIESFEYGETCTKYPSIYRLQNNDFPLQTEEGTTPGMPTIIDDYKDYYYWDYKEKFFWAQTLNTYNFQWSDGEEDYLDYIPVGEDENCESLLGEDLVSELNSYMLYIKIAVPIIIIVMGSLDFGKAFIASDEDAMKKAQKKFIMRLIIGMTIFFIPTLVNALIDVADQIWKLTKGNGTCGIKF